MIESLNLVGYTAIGFATSYMSVKCGRKRSFGQGMNTIR